MGWLSFPKRTGWATRSSSNGHAIPNGSRAREGPNQVPCHRRTVAIGLRAYRLAAVSAVITLSLSPCSADGGGGTHCSVQEQTLFSCSTGSKVVSVCASSDLSTTAGSLQYRFGRTGEPELLYPKSAADWRKLTSGAVLTFAGGGGAYLAFTNGPFRYVVYTAIGQGWGQKAGVAVEKNGKRVASLPCKSKETSELGPDLFAKAGIAEDTKGFDLP